MLKLPKALVLEQNQTFMTRRWTYATTALLWVSSRSILTPGMHRNDNEHWESSTTTRAFQVLAAAAKEWFHHVTVEVKCNHTHTCTLKKKKQQKKRNNNKKKAPKTPILQKQNPNKENQEDFLGNFIFW